MKTLSHTSYRKSAIPVSSDLKVMEGVLINYEWWHLINLCYIKERWVNAWGDSAAPRGFQRWRTETCHQQATGDSMPGNFITCRAEEEQRVGTGQAICCLGNTFLSLKNGSFNKTSHEDFSAIHTIDTDGIHTYHCRREVRVSIG